jgi:hypothetical protein
LVWPKIKLEKVENFQRSNKRHLRTTIHHTITTISPANYHQENTQFSRAPSKTPIKQPKSPHADLQNFFCQIETPKKRLPTKSKINAI